MGFSTPEWLASFVLDVLIKFVAFVAVDAFANFDTLHPITPYLYLLLAAGFSCFHFGCLVLGYVVAAALELVRIELRPRPKFLLGILFANVLFAAVLNTIWALEYAQFHRSVFELSPATVALVATNLLSVLAVYASGAIWQLIRRS